MRRIWQSAYGVWVWVAFAAVALPTVAVLAITPTLQRRRRVVRRSASLVFRLAGISLYVRGLEHIPDTGCVLVANHASYLDGVILTAALPPQFAFVIKREMTRVPVAHYLLRRVGSEFVERFDPHGGARDARRLLQQARARQSLAFFPEGTFHPEPGLRRFHNGAFTAAIRAGLPVVPVTIRGSRAILPGDRRLPSHGHLEVRVQAPLMPHAPEDLAQLLATSRRCILEQLDEPDLAP
jgi:1-acyl-sn-glycerol-3-phosphate acyltransferase